ncbi:PEP-CTERM sorting domain-containing protein [Coraliomargarita parva]|uniref:PEP-CTERM sorting domain-containing protein n=1 Tax=Coraliomargarita parva TaxID=3014050 RepID=UPI0022B5E4C6|nr:PEP-CTERM sorting domain-containing protein [Coraliomargarita parva]
MKNYQKIILCALALTASAVATHADTIAFYGFENVFTSSDSEANTIASAVTWGGGLNPATPVFSGTSFGGSRSLAPQDLTESSAADAVTAGDYLEFTIELGTDVELSLTELTVALQRSNDPGSASDWFVRTSLDGFIADVGSVNPTTTFAEYSIDLSDAAFQNISSDLTFRLYAYGGASSSSSLRHDNLTLLGTVSAIPEPAMTGLLMMGASALCVLAIRRRRPGN